MGAKLNLRGQRFGRLEVLEECGRANGGVLWKCKCDCGNIVHVRANHLRKGAIVSCGCYNAEVISTHKETKTKLYHLLQCMRDRCNNPKSPNYKNYGGRGIQVCDEWAKDYVAFKSWALASGYKEGLTIERIDNNGNYEPNNCRWATDKEQCRNRRTNVFIECDGERHCLAEWAEILSIPYSTIANRYYRGWPDREILYGRA